MEDRVIFDPMDEVFFPKEDTLKVLYCYLNYKGVKNRGSFIGVLGGR